MTELPLDDDALAYKNRTGEKPGSRIHVVGYLSFIIAGHPGKPDIEYAIDWLDSHRAWDGIIHSARR